MANLIPFKTKIINKKRKRIKIKDCYEVEIGEFRITKEQDGTIRLMKTIGEPIRVIPEVSNVITIE